ncbi:MAG: YARHG domain-containing protein [Oculatellaceae cyanobacterium bins.114]|nr:YARHG domain-containing protein [Oculatellaceae cyanobacterium bins.114]
MTPDPRPISTPLIKPGAPTSPIPISVSPTPSPSVAVSPETQQKLFGFNQPINRARVAFESYGFIARWELGDFQLRLTRQDDACNLTAHKSPDAQNMEGLQVRLVRLTPECMGTLKLALNTLAPESNVEGIINRISDFENFVIEASEVYFVTLYDGASIIEARWINNDSDCPVGSCELSISIQSRRSYDSNEFTWLSEREVTTADLEGKSTFELDVLRNSIFARYGRRFDRPDLQTYFDGQSWYEPRYSPSQFPNNQLTDLETSNAQFILDYQKSH